MWLLLLAATLRTIAAANCSLTQPEDVRLAAALDLATAGCGTVVYTTLAYGPGTRLPHRGTRLAEMAREGSACYIVVAGAASADHETRGGAGCSAPASRSGAARACCRRSAATPPPRSC